MCLSASRHELVRFGILLDWHDSCLTVRVRDPFGTLS